MLLYSHPLKKITRLSNDMDTNSQPGTRVSFNQSLESPLRRSRADTMPTQSSPFPYANDMFSASMNHLNDSVVQSTVLPPPPSAQPSSRHRSGSVTLPQNAVYNDTPFNAVYNNPYDPSSPIDENASNTIASTLASLGLDDENNNDYGAEDHSMPTRGRSYTVTGQLAGNDMNTRLAFSPFSPHTRSSVLHRPRAISLGMADSFSPFDMSQAAAAAAGASSVSASVTPNTSMPPNPTRLRMQQSVETPLRSSRSSSNLIDMNMDHVYSMDDDYYGQPDGADSPTSAQAQIPSRALWLGNINPSISVPDLVQLFSTYGQVESARILSDKECAFVNFTTKESAVAAKNDLETRLGSKLGGTPVRVGFGKADVNLAMALTNEAGPNAQGPTRALCKFVCV